MVVVKLQGGLGNQMFQYACGYALAAKLGASLKLDEGSFAHDTLKRTYCLDLFGILPVIVSDKERNAFLRPTLWDRLSAFLDPRTVLREPETDWRYYAAIEACKGSVYLDGYWQSSRYLREYEQEIKKIFSVKKLPLSAHSKPLLAQIVADESVCVNVRRGDFLTNSVIGFVGLDFYVKGYKQLSYAVTNPVFYVFSDDLAWCMEHFGFMEHVVFVGHEHAGDRFATYLKLMANCKHFLIPNSSFAWWAAWLSGTEGQVLAPAKYLQDPSYRIDVVPDNWTKI